VLIYSAVQVLLCCRCHCITVLCTRLPLPLAGCRKNSQMARLFACSRTTGLVYAERGLRSPPNVTRRGYLITRTKSRVLANLGAGANMRQIAQAACNKNNITDPDCVDVLLLALTPASYSSNNTADTPGRRAFIGPAQVSSSKRFSSHECTAV
jgi:hypothetical protein